MNILVVEDYEPVRDRLVNQLSRFGHSVSTATGGDDALAKMRADPPPDLMILDLVLAPGQRDGFAVLHERMLDEELRVIPVIVMTGLSTDSAEEGARAVRNALCGTTLVLPKPASAHTLNLALTLLTGFAPPNPEATDADAPA